MPEERIANLFKKNFIEKRDDRQIVIYGIGEWTRLILDRYPEANIYGLLDGYFCEGAIKGRPIITLELLKGKQVKIIIVARKSSEIVVYKRIADICRNYDIPVFNLEGTRLNPLDSEELPIEEWDTDALYKELVSFDCVSFDIFDTLLVRKTLFREKLYQAMGQIQKLDFDFCRVRLQSERELHENNFEPTLDAIYEQLRRTAKLSIELAEDLKRLEIQLETENLIPRKEIVALYDRLIAQGKRVWLISDMYFSKEIIRHILARNQIRECDGILVSCEHGVNKQKGLFQTYLCQVPVGRKVHVGDCREIDGYCAEENGIVPFVIPSVMDTVVQKRAKDILMNYEYEKPEYMRGLSFSHLFDTKKLISSKIWIQTGYQLGFCLVAPALYGWAKWIYECCIDENLEKVLFVSRDGYLLQKIFQKICRQKGSKIEMEYLIFSRTLGWQASIYAEEDLRELLNFPFAGSISEWLDQRFGILTDDARNFAGNEEEIFGYRDLILKKSAQIRWRYRKYWAEKRIEKKRMALVDFVSTGTCQKCLEKLTGCRLQGLYFEALRSLGNEIKVCDYIHTFWKQGISSYNYLLWEILIKEPGASVKSIDGSGSFVYGENRLCENVIGFIREVHRGVLDFADQYILEMDVMQTEENIDRLVEAAVCLLDERYVEMEESIKRCLRGFDEFTNRELSF